MRAEPYVVILPCDPPLDWPVMLGFYARRAVAGTEEVVNGVYRRSARLGGESGIVELAEEAGRVRAAFWLPPALGGEAVGRVRRMLDLDADLAAISRHLARDPWLAPLVALHPTLRIPGGWDGFEVALRTVLGQQVSIAAARILVTRLVERCGEDLPDGPIPGLSRLFPAPAAVLAADLSHMGMPGARANTLKSLAAAALEDPTLFERRSSVEETVAHLRRVKGVGEWTAQYIAMRAAREPDAFPAGDAGILRGLAEPGGARPGQNEALARAERWRPYRAYAAHHIWARDAATSTAPVMAPEGEAA